ncbi:MAG: adenine phosphoribosyltransferase, partial [Chthoniobacteraceae bacterium]
MIDTAEIRNAVRDVPDFPKPGVIFKDITPLLADGRVF